MGRSPEVFVRPVTMTEGQRLQRIGRTARDPVKLRRAIVVLMSAQGQAVPDIATPGTLGVTALLGCLVLRAPSRCECLFSPLFALAAGMLNCPVTPGLAAVPRAAVGFLLPGCCFRWSVAIRRAGTG
jgi:hypothetical protein